MSRETVSARGQRFDRQSAGERQDEVDVSDEPGEWDQFVETEGISRDGLRPNFGDPKQPESCAA